WCNWQVSYVRPTPPYKNASKVNVTTATGSRAYESEMMGRYRDNFVLPPARCPQPPVQVDLGGCCDLTLAERYQSQAMRDNSTGLQRRPSGKNLFAGSSTRVSSCGIRETVRPRVGDIITRDQQTSEPER
ncbi:hypothetical protein FOZ63_023885, partial [Perkinsus olseni]